MKIPAVRQSNGARIALVFYTEGNKLVMVFRRNGKFVLQRATEAQIEKQFRFHLDRDVQEVAASFLRSIREGTPAWDRAYAALDSFHIGTLDRAETGGIPAEG